MSKHTPGPWEVNDVRVDTKAVERTDHGDTSNMVALVYSRYVGDDYSVGSQKANARLIAAAPDLLAALKEAVEIIEKHVPSDALGVDHMGDFSVPGGVMTWGVLDEHLHYMRQAIKKAEARS